ncbi:MAG: SPOR domain-containing protein [Bacteroidetes bacterium]|nr:MAG: SPOR domain-containing protein [Bacteroidota bacterium]
MRLFLFCFILAFLPLYSFAQRDKIISIERKQQQGWRIEVYKGAIRQEAIDAKKKAYSISEEYLVYMEYAKPNYRIRVGNFINLAECEKVLAQLKTAFPDATIVKATVTLSPNYKED